MIYENDSITPQGELRQNAHKTTIIQLSYSNISLLQIMCKYHLHYLYL